MTMVSAALSDPLAPGAGRVSAAPVPLLSAMVPPFSESAAVELASRAALFWPAPTVYAKVRLAVPATGSIACGGRRN